MFLLVKYILYHKHYADVTMMGAFGKQVHHRVVNFIHKIIDDKQHGLAAVKVRHLQ